VSGTWKHGEELPEESGGCFARWCITLTGNMARVAIADAAAAVLKRLEVQHGFLLFHLRR
jgi:hypothetical protein